MNVRHRMIAQFSRLEAKLATTYSPAYAQTYRNGEEDGQEWLRQESAQWRLVETVASSLPGPSAILDLGCGTGRYFNAYRNARKIIGVDYSEGMLQQARVPVGGLNANVVLVRGNLLNVEFTPHTFDMIACIGVLGASCPFTEDVVRRFRRFVRPGGMVVFTVMTEQKIAHTIKSRLAASALPFLCGSLKDYVCIRLGLFQTPAARVDALTRRHFGTVVSTRWQSPLGNIETHVIATQRGRVAVPSLPNITKL